MTSPPKASPASPPSPNSTAPTTPPHRTYTATSGSARTTTGNNDTTLQARGFCGGEARYLRGVASTATAGSLFVANAFTGTCTSLGAAARDYFRIFGVGFPVKSIDTSAT